MGRRSEFLGHPRGLLVLAGTELWDRISFSGMQAILVLYMVERLFLPEHVANIVGFVTLRRTIEYATGALTPQGLATQIFGLYVGLTYLTPAAGGFVGDRVLGRSRSVILGALLMTAGHFCMAFEASFLLALLLLIVGAGFLRGNLTPQVSELYPLQDKRRSVAFQIYFSMVSIGAFVAPLVTGLLAQTYDWDMAFGFAGVGMLVGLIVYVGGYRTLPRTAPPRNFAARRQLTPAERRVVISLLAILPKATLFWVAQAQIWNTYNLWVRDHVNLQLGSLTVPVPWLQALDGLAALVTLPALLLLWRWQGRKGRAPDDYKKMVVGLFLFAASVGILAAAQALTGASGKIPLIVPVAFHFASNVAWLYFAPSANSLFASTAPASLRGTLTGTYTLSMFFGSIISGRLGGLYETLSPTAFWCIHAALAALGGLWLWSSGSHLRKHSLISNDGKPHHAAAPVDVA